MSEQPYMHRCLELEARVKVLEAALRWAMKQVDDRPWPEREYPADLAPLLKAALA